MSLLEFLIMLPFMVASWILGVYAIQRLAIYLLTNCDKPDPVIEHIVREISK